MTQNLQHCFLPVKPNIYVLFGSLMSTVSRIWLNFVCKKQFRICLNYSFSFLMYISHIHVQKSLTICVLFPWNVHKCLKIKRCSSKLGKARTITESAAAVGYFSIIVWQGIVTVGRYAEMRWFNVMLQEVGWLPQGPRGILSPMYSII